MDTKIWYIDRSRNYYYDELPKGLRSIVDTYYHNDGVMISTDNLIQSLVDSGVISSSAKNKNAHITRFRDHGFIDMRNMPGDYTIDYLNGLLDMD